ncbi:MAG: branched-chain amino acid transporter ATP-binding protein [Pseudomonadota bacterium]
MLTDFSGRCKPDLTGVTGAHDGLTVEGNLRLGALVFANSPSVVDLSVERGFPLFPRLAERRAQLAGSLSGGEQQILAIGRGLDMTEAQLAALSVATTAGGSLFRSEKPTVSFLETRKYGLVFG